MKKLLAVFALTLFAFAALAVEPPQGVKASPTNLNGDAATPVISVTWTAPAIAPDSYEVQRKLFPWGWRAVGTARAGNTAWLDRKPAKRVAAYRVRAIDDGVKSKWSKTVKAIKP